MDIKMPYYMTYPMPFLFDDEKEADRDYEYLRSMYPELAKQIMLRKNAIGWIMKEV